jgi:hypothetical protein
MRIEWPYYLSSFIIVFDGYVGKYYIPSRRIHTMTDDQRTTAGWKQGQCGGDIVVVVPEHHCK